MLVAAATSSYIRCNRLHFSCCCICGADAIATRRASASGEIGEAAAFTETAAAVFGVDA